jgi:hypothetical protein
MNGQLRPLQESDLPRLEAFLRQVFAAPPEAQFAARQMLAWKYLTSDPVWAGDLSYVLERDGRLAAHAGACPVVFRSPTGRRVTCATIIDWAADRGTPGAGLVVCRHVMQLADATFLIGGTATTWALAPSLGFRPVLQARVYVRWVRPLKEFWLRPKNPRAALRLLHGVARAPFGRLAARRGWGISPVSRFDESAQSVVAAAPRLYSAAERTLAQLNHRLDCPATATRGYLLLRSDTILGYAIATVGKWEAKILDLRLNSQDPKDWAAAYAVVTDRLSKEPGVCRICALASVPMLQQALESNSYWVSRVEPVAFYDPRQLMEALLPVDIQFFESDLGHDNAS